MLGILLVKMVREVTFELMLSGKETTRRGIGGKCGLGRGDIDGVQGTTRQEW